MIPEGIHILNIPLSWQPVIFTAFALSALLYVVILNRRTDKQALRTIKGKFQRKQPTPPSHAPDCHHLQEHSPPTSNPKQRPK